MIDQVSEMIRMQREASFKASGQLSLGLLVDFLEVLLPNADDDGLVRFDFGGFVPTDFRSWRGSYSEFAIGYAESKWEDRPTLGAFVGDLRRCVGAVYPGWKGGEFVMSRTTPVWVANAGESGNTGVTGVRPLVDAKGRVFEVVLQTGFCEY